MRKYSTIPHPLTESELERFWAKVDRSGGPDACWIWTASKTRGYGKIRIRDKSYLATRVSYTITHGEFDPILLVCHNCPDGDNRTCVNPDHLFLGSHSDNIRDAYAKGRSPSFPRGEKQGGSLLTEDSVRDIWRMYKHEGISRPEIARRIGVTSSCVYAVISRQNWGRLDLS